MNSNCLICNTLFVKRVIGENTCCEICKEIYKIRKASAYNSRNIIDKLPNERRCIICDKLFIAKKIDSVTCSWRCSETYERKHRHEDYNHPAYYYAENNLRGV